MYHIYIYIMHPRDCVWLWYNTSVYCHYIRRYQVPKGAAEGLPEMFALMMGMVAELTYEIHMSGNKKYIEI